LKKLACSGFRLVTQRPARKSGFMYEKKNLVVMEIKGNTCRPPRTRRAARWK
jgi:hypothetical protein